MGRIRGTIMHPSELNGEECRKIIDFIIDDKYPGPFFFSIGIDTAY